MNSHELSLQASQQMRCMKGSTCPTHDNSMPVSACPLQMPSRVCALCATLRVQYATAAGVQAQVQYSTKELGGVP